MAIKVAAGAGVPAGVRFRGTWTPTTAYVRGDVVIDPTAGQQLRQATLDHTSAGSWATGNEFTTTNQWHPVSFPGFRGAWVADDWYPVNDHVVSPESGLIVQCKVSHRSATFVAAKWGPSLLPFPSTFRPDVLLGPQGVPDLGPLDVAPVKTKRSRLRYPRGTRVATFETAADFDSVTGTGSVSQDANPINPNGCVKLNFPVTATKAIPAIDISDSILRVPCKDTLAQRPNVTNCRLDVCSDVGGFASGNYSSWRMVKNTDKNLPDGAWDWLGCGPDAFVNTTLDPSCVVGTGADLSAVTAIRFRGTVTTSTAYSISVAHLDAVPITGTKGKVVLRFDDNYLAGWTVAAAYLIPRGIPFVLASTINGAVPSQSSGQLSAQMIRYLTDFHRVQVMSHAYSTNEHNDAGAGYGGEGLRAHWAKARHLQDVFGTNGGDDMAWFGNIQPDADNIRAARQNFRSGSLFINAPRVVETLPPTNAHRLWGYGAGTSDITDEGAAMIAYADAAGAQKGLAQYTWHNLSAANVDFYNLVDHVIANPSTLEFATMAEALEPWTVAP